MNSTSKLFLTFLAWTAWKINLFHAVVWILVFSIFSSDNMNLFPGLTEGCKTEEILIQFSCFLLRLLSVIGEILKQFKYSWCHETVLFDE